MHHRAQTLSRPTNDRVACRSNGSRELIGVCPWKRLGQSNVRQSPPRQEQRASKGLFGGCITPVRHKLFHALSFLLSILPTHSLFLNLPAVLLGIFLHLLFFPSSLRRRNLTLVGDLKASCPFVFFDKPRCRVFRRRAHLSFLKSVRDRKFSPNVDAGRFTLYPHSPHGLDECIVFP